MRVRVLIAGLAALGAVAVPAPAASAAALEAFGSCDELVKFAREKAEEIRGPDQPSPPPTAAPAPAGEEGAGAGGEFSRTNVQEAGVDEPDIVKSDGSRLFAAIGQRLYAVDLQARTPRVLGSIALDGFNHELLLYGDRLLVVSSGPQVVALGRRALSPLPPGVLTTTLSEVDVARPAAMRVVRTLSVQGRYVDARLVGAGARVVISSTPRGLQVPVAAPEQDGTQPRPPGEDIDLSSPSAWLPSSVLEERGSGQRTQGLAVPCDAVRRPPEFAGLDILAVLTIDLSQGLRPADSDGLMTDAETVYASRGGLYATSQRFEAPDSGPGAPPTTAIHKFDISQPRTTEYRASGEVQGTVLNQFSLSEHAGDLRAATTSEPPGASGGRSQSFVTVLAERSGELVQVGRVGNLGRGERIFAVRFIGDVGYVVTFRQVDPLYTLDLSDPARPRTVGALKILGYSAYIHPVGEDRLLGIGQDADPRGRLLGTQLSLFDISNLANPRRLGGVAIGAGSSSEVEYEHHAFLYWPPARLAVMPVQITAPIAPGETGASARRFVGAIGFRIGGAAPVREAGRITAAGGEEAQPIRRALVAGDRLLTVSDAGVGVNSLDTLTRQAFVPFAR